MIERGFDFSKDYRLINELGMTLFERSKQFRGEKNAEQHKALLEEAAANFEKTLSLDSENVEAHFNLALIYAMLGNEDQALKHRELHARYKPDDNARDKAIAIARKKYPAADRAAEAVVIYPLQRAGAPQLPPEAASVVDSLRESEGTRGASAPHSGSGPEKPNLKPSTGGGL
jgi:tetratricopeptide (TPR) repeat protein